MMAFIGLSDWEKFILLRCWIRLKALVDGARNLTNSGDSLTQAYVIG
ncbi:MAG: hypothetical protein OEY91_05585 [Nitrospirota bacterium]|nr:hypothetical protein [Nitrospirota bacterium]